MKRPNEKIEIRRRNLNAFEVARGLRVRWWNGRGDMWLWIVEGWER
jgi:hypothetical protein